MASASSTTKTAGLIFLHGLGDGPSGWSSLAHQLPSLRSRLSQLEYVFPASPEIPISINGGMRMPGWFDLFEWPIQVGDPDDRKGKLAALQQMETEIEQLVQRGIPRHKIAIGGFSQGGAIALLTAYYSSSSATPAVAARPPLAACVSLSGWLTLTQDMVVAPPNQQTPLFWGHGRYDDKVLFTQQQFGVDKLTELGVKDVKAESYAMGHSADPREIQQLADFLDTVLFEKGASDGGGDSKEL